MNLHASTTHLIYVTVYYLYRSVIIIVLHNFCISLLVISYLFLNNNSNFSNDSAFWRFQSESRMKVQYVNFNVTAGALMWVHIKTDDKILKYMQVYDSLRYIFLIVVTRKKTAHE